MAEEEFKESEVIFSDNNNTNEVHVSSKHGRLAKSSINNNSVKSYNKTRKVNSRPINIPELRSSENNDYDGDESLNSDFIVPPHLLIRRRRISGGNMAYSLCSGTGRTLKGRDLSRVRNSILRLTGFLET